MSREFRFPSCVAVTRLIGDFGRIKLSLDAQANCKIK